MISSFLVLSLTFGGCGRSDQGGTAIGQIQGWEKTSPSARHTAADLHKYLDGGAAKYLAYSIKELLVQEYKRGSDGFAATLELYRMDSPQNAFGVYSCDRIGRHPKGIGLEASYEGGLLQFWQGDYFVRVQAQDPSGDPSQAVLELGTAVSSALPAATSTPPELALSMPERGIVKDSLCFFHNQITLNSIYYISDENLLELSADTDAVTAEYRTQSDAIARVIVVHYPDPGTAAETYEALRGAFMERPVKQADRGEGVFVSVDGRVLAIVFEAGNDSEAEVLGKAVLKAVARAENVRGEETK